VNSGPQEIKVIYPGANDRFELTGTAEEIAAKEAIILQMYQR
jgi:hypothetical protein